ncbi:MAG: hypothetical protein PHQ22_10525 [Sulfuricurvum sp.]|nr:hypothetical protein [Sulfuricurvum sp.]
MRQITIDVEDMIFGLGVAIVIWSYAPLGYVMIGCGLGYDAKPSIQRLALAFSLYMKRK